MNGMDYLKRDSLAFALDLLKKVNPSSVLLNEKVTVELILISDHVSVKCRREPNVIFYSMMVNVKEIKRDRDKRSLKLLLKDLYYYKFKANNVVIQVKGKELVELTIREGEKWRKGY